MTNYKLLITKYRSKWFALRSLEHIFMKRKATNGFSLIELIVYIALVGIFVTGTMYYSFDVLHGREKAMALKKTDETALAVLSRIRYEILDAEEVNSVTPTQLSLSKNNGSINPTIITFTGNTITIQQGGGAVQTLTSNQIVINNGAFIDLRSADNMTHAISVHFTVSQAQPTNFSQFIATTDVETSVELNNPFNAGRKLLINAGSVTLHTGAKFMQGLTIQNAKSTGAPIILDKVMLTWTGGIGTTVTQITIDGVTVWSGSASSGTTLDITNVSLVAGAAATLINTINFNASMTGSVVSLTGIMTDGSLAKAQIIF